jgi:hypothetical protein
VIQASRWSLGQKLALEAGEILKEFRVTVVAANSYKYSRRNIVLYNSVGGWI